MTTESQEQRPFPLREQDGAPLFHGRKDRRLSSRASSWQRSFTTEHVRPLVVCRGPVRKEALEIFEDMGMEHAGMLLSEKDSVVYPQALAPELRMISRDRVHPIPDYSGNSKEEREARTADIIQIAKDHGYTHIFAGYGFMAEDASFVAAIEKAGLGFIGPHSSVHQKAGLKDEAKRTAIKERVSITPGEDAGTRLTLLRLYPDKDSLFKLSEERQLGIDAELFRTLSLEALADRLLQRSYELKLDLFSVDQLIETLKERARVIFTEHPGKRLRLKAIGGGGGKGQRILEAPGDEPQDLDRQISALGGLVREVLGEVKALGEGDNKNLLLELNIERTRHNEIQLIGNGLWCVSLGGRDCSLQMHEQKLLEFSLTQEGLQQALEEAQTAGKVQRAESLAQQKLSLKRMEEEAERFGQAVGLDSVSTFECIVEADRHYFMEVNTRLQVEHRVSELVYGLRFQNPSDDNDVLEVDSLIELMVLLACHGERLPKPSRYPREAYAVEARLNATNEALEPHAGGLVRSWSALGPNEIRDDQGICLRNPDTGAFMDYRIAGAYDSNIALLLTYGKSRSTLFQNLIEMLRRTRLRGKDIKTNLSFHLGLATWLGHHHPWAKPTTRFVSAYLAAVGALKGEQDQVDIAYLWRLWAERFLEGSPYKAEFLSLLPALATIVTRPMGLLLEDAHLSSAYISMSKDWLASDEEGLFWSHPNPVKALEKLYWLLGLEFRPKAPAANVIWRHDQALLLDGLAFYEDLRDKLGDLNERQLQKRLSEEAEPSLAALWPDILRTHAFFHFLLEILKLPHLLAREVGFSSISVDERGEISLPEQFMDKDFQKESSRHLAPPLEQTGNRILAPSGGMLYLQEAPDRPPFIKEGEHFEKGQPLFIIEVMKMFNKVYAPFSGTLEKIEVKDSGSIVKKGQSIFLVKPDEAPRHVDPEEKKRLIEARTQHWCKHFSV